MFAALLGSALGGAIGALPGAIGAGVAKGSKLRQTAVGIGVGAGVGLLVGAGAYAVAKNQQDKVGETGGMLGCPPGSDCSKCPRSAGCGRVGLGAVRIPF